MVCMYCGGKTEVINSRHQKRNNQIWRRRRCLACNATFTTHEILDYSTSVMVDNSGKSSPFVADRLYADILEAVRDVKEPHVAARELTSAITQKLLKNASNEPILAQNISLETGSTLKRFNKQAWLRYIANHPSAQGDSKLI